jgi:two-component system, chemotaxis family, protein-glutamate methylesterase/glutaminase
MADAGKQAGEDPRRLRPARRERIVIGGSAGSLDTLRAIVHQFPADFPGTLFVVVHVGQSRSTLLEILRNAGNLNCSHPQDKEPIRKAHIYVAPPDRRMLIEDGNVCLSRGPREHFTRPAIDPLFRSAARYYGPRVIGVVLSGRGSDGATGLDAIRRAGGLTLIEDPSMAAFPDMPLSAASISSPQLVVRTAEIPDLLLRLSQEEIAEDTPAKEGAPFTMEIKELERPVTFFCPECGGALNPSHRSPGGGYGCQIGHRFGAMELLEA